jgi:hypothetical protein
MVDSTNIEEWKAMMDSVPHYGTLSYDSEDSGDGTVPSIGSVTIEVGASVNSNDNSSSYASLCGSPLKETSGGYNPDGGIATIPIISIGASVDDGASLKDDNALSFASSFAQATEFTDLIQARRHDVEYSNLKALRTLKRKSEPTIRYVKRIEQNGKVK